MVVTTCRDEGCLITHPLLQFESKNLAPELERPLDIGDLEMDVTDVNTRVNRLARHTISLTLESRL